MDYLSDRDAEYQLELAERRWRRAPDASARPFLIRSRRGWRLGPTLADFRRQRPSESVRSEAAP
jgi:hypothetical protein